ncbi:MAG: hypothetical protein C3F06_03070 [Candidatus Methanoperedenaceae archaeon]|nr:MAG: hypothetical protein C3F06_03070 [Candidatus Methanoperedenaceae archaeon]
MNLYLHGIGAEKSPIIVADALASDPGDRFDVVDDSLEDSANLPDPDIIAKDIAENLEDALEQFRSIQEDLVQAA